MINAKVSSLWHAIPCTPQTLSLQEAPSPVAFKDPPTCTPPPTTLPSRGLCSRTLREEGNGRTEGEGEGPLSLSAVVVSSPTP